MDSRPISSLRQLGASIYDARIAAGLTQAALASQAGVSRRWLIGLEQGKRTGAELGKLFDVLHALGLSIHLSETQDLRGSATLDQRTDDSVGDSLATPSKPNFNPETLEAIRRMRENLSSNTAALEAAQRMRENLSSNTAALEAAQRMRENLSFNTAALEAAQRMRENLSSNTAALDALRRSASPLNTIDAMRRATLHSAAFTALEKTTEESSHKSEDEEG